MKKFIYIIGISLLLTGFSYETFDTVEYDGGIDDVDYIEYSREGLYLNEDMKAVVEDINALREKYKDEFDDTGFDSFYITIYKDNIQGMDDVSFNNYDIRNSEYFNDLVEVLDSSIASGLKDYVSEVKSKRLEADGMTVEKIGRTAVYAEDRGDSNYIDIKINLLDIRDDYYSQIFKTISDDKYILGKVVMGEDLNLIDFGNISGSHYMYPYDNLSIRYNMFFKDKDFKKINILIQGKNGEEPEYDDVGVFINLLNNLDIKKQDEKDTLISEYKNALKGKSKNKEMSFDNYNLLIKSGKGDTYTGNDRKLVYFSLQAK